MSYQGLPDLGGAPELIEITDLDDDTQRFLLGVQSLGILEFTANYVEANYDSINSTREHQVTIPLNLAQME